MSSDSLFLRDEGDQFVRVALINDGTYPYRAGVGGTWTHRLVRGLPEHAFHFVTVTDQAPSRAVFHPPMNTLTITSIVLGGPGIGPTKRKAALAHRRAATHAAVLLCRGMLDDTPESVAMFRSALRRLASGASENTHALHGVPLGLVLLDAWKAAATARRSNPARLPSAALPVPTVADAHQAANLIERALRPLSTPLPLTELNHASDAGLAALVALGAKWRMRTPYVLTEHETYLTAPLLAHAAGRPAVRAVLLRFFRALARLAYQEAAVVAAVSEPLRAWALDHGADRERLSLVPYGVDPHSCTILRGEPVANTITWLGPQRDLQTMVAALPEIRMSTPDARVLVAGAAVTIDDREQAELIGFLGPLSHRRSAYANGKIVVLSGADDSMPYALIEAMMCGRPTIVVDGNGLGTAIGMGAMVVAPNNPAALAEACMTLLADRDRRRQLSIAGGQRARSIFALRAKLDRFRDIYERASRDTRAATEPLVTIPLTTTVRRWLPPKQAAGDDLSAAPSRTTTPANGAAKEEQTAQAEPDTTTTSPITGNVDAKTVRAPNVGERKPTPPPRAGSEHDYWAKPTVVGAEQ